MPHPYCRMTRICFLRTWCLLSIRALALACNDSANSPDTSRRLNNLLRQNSHSWLQQNGLHFGGVPQLSLAATPPHYLTHQWLYKDIPLLTQSKFSKLTL